MDQLVLQWTADSQARTAVYPSALYGQSTTTDVVGPPSPPPTTCTPSAPASPS
ncbi:hypothetical protein ACFPOI_24500 [Nonomuraea angiospora]|uniref:Uncharacterized protein n=1 Tax=Nonomuraea angiospora TaxID=46172 RepID=A0ABR9MLK7_9ACTN|nr:hypothetical protein [Nonomuraea angiospora]MBE1593841.1 hypothetical protein [Nonomuraea angiospora]